MIIDSFFVLTRFRGLGIGSELLSLCLSKLKETGKTWILIPNLLTPEKIEPLLFRMGFDNLGSGYAAKLQ
jgi:GNAT superfamily N-acetyltransferase